jgi:hypothetical protein
MSLRNPLTGTGLASWVKHFEGCPSADIICQIDTATGASSLTVLSPARAPAACVPPAAVYAWTGGNLTLQSALEGTGWPGRMSVRFCVRSVCHSTHRMGSAAIHCLVSLTELTLFGRLTPFEGGRRTQRFLKHHTPRRMHDEASRLLGDDWLDRGRARGS